MNDQLRKRIVYGLAVAGLIWAALNFQSKPAQPVAESVPEVPVVAAEAVETEPVPASGTAIKREIDLSAIQTTNKQWGNDPFRKRATRIAAPVEVRSAPAPALNWSLTGVMYNASSPLAIVNGKPVGVGEEINGARVVEIRKRSITLEHQGERFTLAVKEGR